MRAQYEVFAGLSRLAGRTEAAKAQWDDIADNKWKGKRIHRKLAHRLRPTRS